MLRSGSCALTWPTFAGSLPLCLKHLGSVRVRFSIDVEHGRRKSPPYRTLDELVADTRLPDELSNVTVSAYTSYDEPNRLSIRFSTFLRPSLSVDGSDEGSVIGQCGRIAEFLKSRESLGTRVANWFNRWWLLTALLGIPAGIIGPSLWRSHPVSTILVAAAYAVLLLYGLRMVMREGFTLILRPRETEGLGRFITRENALPLVLAALLLVIAAITYLFPRAPH